MKWSIITHTVGMTAPASTAARMLGQPVGEPPTPLAAELDAVEADRLRERPLLGQRCPVQHLFLRGKLERPWSLLPEIQEDLDRLFLMLVEQLECLCRPSATGMTWLTRAGRSMRPWAARSMMVRCNGGRPSGATVQGAHRRSVSRPRRCGCGGTPHPARAPCRALGRIRRPRRGCSMPSRGSPHAVPHSDR